MQPIASALYGLQNTASGAADAVLRAVLKHATSCNEAPAGQHISMALYGLRGQNDSELVRGLLVQLHRLLLRSQHMNSRAIANTLFGLQRQPSGDAVRGIVAVCAKRLVDAGPSSGPDIAASVLGLGAQRHTTEAEALAEAVAGRVPSVQMTAKSIAHAFLGMRGQSSSGGMLKLLGALTTALRECPGRVSAELLGVSLYGIQRQTEPSAVADLMEELAVRASVIDEDPISNQHIAMALYGLRSQVHSHHHTELLRNLLPLVPRSDTMSPLSIANSLYGLRNCLWAEPLPELAAALLPQVERCAAGGERPMPVDVANSVHGLHALGDVHPSRQMLAAIAGMADRCEETFSAQDVASSLYGLHGLGDSPEVRTMLGAVLRQMRKRGVLPKGEACIGLFGLRGQGASPEGRQVLELLVAPLSSEDPVSAPQLSMATQALLAMQEDGAEVTEALASVAEQLRHIGTTAPARQMQMLTGVLLPADATPMPPSNPGPSNEEELLLAYVLRRAGVKGVRMNVEHVTGFEMDVLCEGPNGPVNVELAGISITYRAPGKQTVRRLRDELLLKHYGITVQNVDTTNKSLVDVVEVVRAACGGDAGSPEWRTAAALARSDRVALMWRAKQEFGLSAEARRARAGDGSWEPKQ
eukprot:TRINITY_DN17273_c0_g1_i1.p1 TRINITY_DN17273_c0_g1~~TRINITY_DN17273_c0_g1_i1.p1  ORF type:complete len:752 (+),score=209.71 TRINITY_DN17273_c0_g1_i1:333-2258(+)